MVGYLATRLERSSAAARHAVELLDSEALRLGRPVTRALAAEPDLLVCDEITSGLDPITRRTVLDALIAFLQRRNDLSLVLITHDLDAAGFALHHADAV